MILTNSQELRRFHKQLMLKAPEGYKPWYFPVIKEGKDPDSKEIWNRGIKGCKCGGFWNEIIVGRSPEGKDKKKYPCFSCGCLRTSWKAPHAQMTIYEATEHLKSGHNIGFSARRNDAAVIIDLDDPSVPELIKTTLAMQSRSRHGRHRVGFTNDSRLKANITTSNKGEVRSLDEYIVAPGSYVPVSQEDVDKLPEKEKALAGRYTVENDSAAEMLALEDIPEIFRVEAERMNVGPREKKSIINLPDNCSALFKLKITDCIPYQDGRFPHPIHGSKTGINTCFIGEELICCWRCLVTLNALQYLAVKAGYADCKTAGTPHGGGRSQLEGDEGIIFYAWKQAKEEGIIPADDPIPVKAMHYLAKKKEWIPHSHKGKLPRHTYNNVLKLDLRWH